MANDCHRRLGAELLSRKRRERSGLLDTATDRRRRLRGLLLPNKPTGDGIVPNDVLPADRAVFRSGSDVVCSLRRSGMAIFHSNYHDLSRTVGHEVHLHHVGRLRDSATDTIPATDLRRTF